MQQSMKPCNVCVGPKEYRFQRDVYRCNGGPHRSPTWLHSDRVSLTERQSYPTDLHLLAHQLVGLKRGIESRRVRGIQEFREISPFS
jgi:hypothetical protein